MTTAALRRHDHLFVSAGGKPDRRGFLSPSAATVSCEDICSSATHQTLRLASGRFIPRLPNFLCGLVGPGFQRKLSHLIDSPLYHAAASPRFGRQSRVSPEMVSLTADPRGS